MKPTIKDIFKEIFGDPVKDLQKIISELKGEKMFCNYEIEGIHHWDAPDYVDAFISSATAVLPDGSHREATEEELETLNEDRDLVYELVLKKIY